MKRLSLIVFFSLFFGPVFSQSQKSIDSLRQVIAGSKDKTVILQSRFKLAEALVGTGQTEEAESLNSQLLSEARKAGDKKNMIRAYHNWVGFLFVRNRIDSAHLVNDSLLRLAIELHDTLRIIVGVNYLGSYYYFKNDYKKALQYYDSALRIEAKAGVREGTYASLNNVALIYLETNIPAMAIRYLKKSAKNANEAKKKYSLLMAYDYMADAYTVMKKYDSAIYCANLSLNLAIESNRIPKIAASHSAIGDAYRAMGMFDSAIVHYNKAMEINKGLRDVELNYNIYGGLAETYFKQNRMEEAEKMAERLRALSNEYSIIAEDKELYLLYSMIEYKKKSYKKAHDYLRDYYAFRDSCYNLEVSSQISEINTKYETEKKEKANQLLQAQNQLSQSALKQQRNVIIFVIVGLLITLSMLYFIFRGLKNQKQANRIITEQKHLVEEKQKEILDSIHYAKRIQNTLLAHADFVNEHIPGNFILFKPKDIVSGDFYWATKHNNFFYLAVCDSTGHGVPGAFMSLLNIGFLNEAINEKDILSPDQIFNHVRNRLVNSISKEGQKDGFDGILLCIDLLTKKISYAAANNAPVIVSGGEAIYCDCDKMPVGKGEKDMAFTLHRIELKKNDTLYLYTDGYPDQFGGPKGKKFMYKQLNLLLAGNAAKPLNEQKQLLDEHFEKWRSGQEQVDDVCVIGIRL